MQRINNTSVLSGEDIKNYITNQKAQFQLIADVIDEKYPLCRWCEKRIVEGDKDLRLCSSCLEKSEKHQEY